MDCLFCAAWDPSQPYNDPSNSYFGSSIHHYQTLPAPQHPIHVPPPLPRSQSADAPPLPPLPPSLLPGGRDPRSSASSSPSDIFEHQSDHGLPHRGSDVALSQGQSFYSGMQRHTQSYTAGVSRPRPPPPPRKPTELQQAQSSPPPIPPKQVPSYPSLPTVPPKISLYPRSIPGPVII